MTEEIQGRPAELSPRIAAGVIDALILVALGAFLSLLPLWFGALTLPMLGAFVAILAYSIVPLFVFGATIGMRLFGIELIAVNGGRPDLFDIMFRDLFGRGLIGFAYFGFVLFAVFGMMTNSVAFFQPQGLGLVLFMLCGLASVLGMLGHLLVLTQKDRRGLHDMIGKTLVIERGSAPAVDHFDDLDEEETAMLARRRGKRIRNFVIFEIVAISVTIALPFVELPAGDAQGTQERLAMANAKIAFEKRPTDPSAARQYTGALRGAGKVEDADEIWDAHLAAIAMQEQLREAAIRKSHTERPDDWDTFESLLTLLEQQSRIDEAKAAFVAFAETNRADDGVRASYAVWLYQNEFTEEAITKLEAEIERDQASAGLHFYLGAALLDSGDKPGARAAFMKALEIDPELEDAQDQLDELGTEPAEAPPAGED